MKRNKTNRILVVLGSGILGILLFGMTGYLVGFLMDQSLGRSGTQSFNVPDRTVILPFLTAPFGYFFGVIFGNVWTAEERSLKVFLHSLGGGMMGLIIGAAFVGLLAFLALMAEAYSETAKEIIGATAICFAVVLFAFLPPITSRYVVKKFEMPLR